MWMDVPPCWVGVPVIRIMIIGGSALGINLGSRRQWGILPTLGASEAVSWGCAALAAVQLG